MVTTGPTRVRWEPAAGQCLMCGGRGGWWSGEFRETCPRCHGGGWDPAREEPWFRTLVRPAQQQQEGP